MPLITRVQLQNAPEPYDHNHTCCLPQSAGLWLSPLDASHLQGRGKGDLHPKQHGEVYLCLLGPTGFIEIAQFLLASLDKLVAANKPEAFEITGRYEPNSDRRELLLRKGVYPYEYMDSWEHFDEPKLPPRKPSSASLQTSTTVRMTTPMRKGCGRLSGVATRGTTTTSTTTQTCSF